MKIRKALVTGGCGFIGSHVVDRLVDNGVDVIVYDNFSTGFLRNIEHLGNRIKVVEGDILDTAKITYQMNKVDTVFHFAANADVRGGMKNTLIDMNQNVLGTHSVLEAAKVNNVKRIIFSSSATVYGEPSIFPTPEDSELIQTSVYGASKLCGEAYIEAYSEYFDIQSFTFRFVSWIGERYSHGVIFDFVKKLLHNPNELEILGDGNQIKSYLYVEDGIDGIFSSIENSFQTKNVFNLGHDEQMTVVNLANIICSEMGLNEVAYHFTGGERGWIGDSPYVHLETEKIKKLGWVPKISIEQGIRKTVRYLLENKQIFEKR